MPDIPTFPIPEFCCAPPGHPAHWKLNVQLVKLASPCILIHTQQFLGVIVTVLATDPAVQEEKFLVMNVLSEPVITRFESGCTPSVPLPNKESDEGRNPISNFPVVPNTGILFSSPAPLDVFTKASLLGTSLAPVSHTLVLVHLCAAVASSTVPFTVSLAFKGAVPVETICHWFADIL